MSRRSIESLRSVFVRVEITQAITAFLRLRLRSTYVTRIVEMWTGTIEIDTWARKESHVPPVRIRSTRFGPLSIEQFFGWGKTVGGLRKTRLRGVRRNVQLMCLTGLAYNLVRISRMCPSTG